MKNKTLSTYNPDSVEQCCQLLVDHSCKHDQDHEEICPLMENQRKHDES